MLLVCAQVPRALSSKHARQGARLLSETAQVLRTECTEASAAQGTEEKVTHLRNLGLIYKISHDNLMIIFYDNALVTVD